MDDKLIEDLLPEDSFPGLPIYERLRGIITNAKIATDYFKEVKSLSGFERTQLSDLIVDYLCNTNINYSEALIEVIEKIAKDYHKIESMKANQNIITNK